VGEEYKVIFGPRSRTDLRDVVTYIARASQSRSIAEGFGRALIQKALTLSQFPERGRVVPEIGTSDIREIIFRSYRIVYRISGRTVQIVRFWHAARGTPELTIDDFREVD
jgi:toxin ParE1/3/4